jgi:glycosyltransferase involved in cell wall biosynthesis
MKIAIMLRGVDKQGGTGVYAKNLVPRLLELGYQHEWTLLYQAHDQLESFQLPDYARGVVLPSGNSIYWDQVLVPRYVRKEGIDVLFNAKFTLPVIRPKRVAQVMSLHGASWYVIPECYPWWDVLYIKLMMPRYCRAADHLISNSMCTTSDYQKYVGVESHKISTVPLAAADYFERVTDVQILTSVRQKYGLPKSFVLNVGGYDPRKNILRLLEAFLKCRKSEDVKLVLVGKGCERFRDDVPELFESLGDSVVLTGWVDQRDLPAIYSLATVFFFPSVYEEFGIPNCEALACGVPILSSNTAAPPEVVGDAGLLVDPTSIEEMARALERLLTDQSLRTDLSERAMRRSKSFSWDRTARETLQVLVEAGSASVAA